MQEDCDYVHTKPARFENGTNNNILPLLSAEIKAVHSGRQSVVVVRSLPMSPVRIFGEVPQLQK